MKIHKQNERGAVVLLYVALMVVISMLFLTVAQSRLMLSLKRSVASNDSLLTSYQAESEVNDYLAKLVGNYIDVTDLTESGTHFNKTISGTTLDIFVSGDATKQTVTATAKRAYAVSKIEGIRIVQTPEDPKDVEIALILDCTGSMTGKADGDQFGSHPTRFEKEREAATISFIDEIKKLPTANKYHLGLGIFGTNAKWVNASWVNSSYPDYPDQEVSPDSGISLDIIRNVIASGIHSSDRDGICKKVEDYTSVGSGYALANSYFNSDLQDTNKNIVLITDGVPNSRVEDLNCPPSLLCHTDNDDDDLAANPGEPENCGSGVTFCKKCLGYAKNYLRCTLAGTNKYIAEIGYNGTRKPDVDAYGITIHSPVNADVQEIFTNYGTPGGYFNAVNANALPALLNKVLNIIVSGNSSFSIKRIIPTE
jgi:hypothetical protein